MTHNVNKAAMRHLLGTDSIDERLVQIEEPLPEHNKQSTTSGSLHAANAQDNSGCTSGTTDDTVHAWDVNKCTSYLLKNLLLRVQLLVGLPFITLHTHSVPRGTALRGLHQLNLHQQCPQDRF